MYLYLGGDKTQKGTRNGMRNGKVQPGKSLVHAWSTIVYSDCLPLIEIVFVWQLIDHHYCIYSAWYPDLAKLLLDCSDHLPLTVTVSDNVDSSSWLYVYSSLLPLCELHLVCFYELKMTILSGVWGAKILSLVHWTVSTIIKSLGTKPQFRAQRLWSLVLDSRVWFRV